MLVQNSVMRFSQEPVVFRVVQSSVSLCPRAGVIMNASAATVKACQERVREYDERLQDIVYLQVIEHDSWLGSLLDPGLHSMLLYPRHRRS
jgi:hypothetical protein